MAPVTSPYNELLRFPDIIGEWMSTETLDFFALSKEIFRQSQMIGYLNAFHLFGLAAAFSIPVCFLFRDTKKLST